MSATPIAAAGKLKRIREAFVRQLPQQLDGIRTAYRDLLRCSCCREEMENFHRRIHTLKGACATFGLKGISETASIAEQLAKDVMLSDDAPDKVWHQKIQHYVDRLEAEIDGVDLSVAPDNRAVELVAVADIDSGRDQKLIYICEDDSFQRLSLATQIECFGFKVISFSALDQMSSAVAHSKPDAIVMDMMFPERPTGGADLISELRHNGYDLPVVFISSQSDFKNRLAAVRAGSSAYFVKPLNVTELCASLDTLTNAVTPDPYRVLIVDDEPHLAELYSTILQSAGMETLTVNDPLQILQPLMEFKPDLVLTDMYMPGCSGMELAKTIRQIGNSFSVPIIYLSSETDVGKQFQAMRMGGDEFLTKPISSENLIAAVAGRAGRMKTIRSFMVRDSMTGLFNHTTTKEYLETAIAAASRNGTELCFAMIDVDRFKTINDTYGHQMGDQVLTTLSRLLQQRLGKSGIVGRYGGEEFAAILTETSIENGLMLLDQLRENFASLRFPVGDSEFTSSFSAGIAQMSRFNDADLLCKAADSALYRAKESGRNMIAVAENTE